MRKKIVYYFVFFLTFFIFQGTSISLKADPEEELMELLTKRSLNRLDKKEEENIPSLFQKVESDYKKHTPEEETKDSELLKVWLLMVISPEEGFEKLFQIAKRGHTHSQYLAGLHLCHRENSKGFQFLSFAAGKGHQLAFERLDFHANKLNNPHAIFELGGVFIDKGDNLAAAQCLKRSLQFPQLFRDPKLTRGFILHLEGDFSGALQYYRLAAKDHPKLAYKCMYGNLEFLIHCIKNKLYDPSELRVAEDQLLEFAKSDTALQVKIKELSKDSPSLSSVYMRAVIKPASKNVKNSRTLRAIPTLTRQRSKSQSMVHRVKGDGKDVNTKQKSYSADGTSGHY